ncbi:MAG: hypothetical protein SFY81_15025 [Verrucomicrobiota bacterium]|nr:hypothetical protein [Verrucomicrobiota bacterium]
MVIRRFVFCYVAGSGVENNILRKWIAAHVVGVRGSATGFPVPSLGVGSAREFDAVARCDKLPDRVFLAAVALRNAGFHDPNHVGPHNAGSVDSDNRSSVQNHPGNPNGECPVRPVVSHNIPALEGWKIVQGERFLGDHNVCDHHVTISHNHNGNDFHPGRDGLNHHPIELDCPGPGYSPDVAGVQGNFERDHPNPIAVEQTGFHACHKVGAVHPAPVGNHLPVPIDHVDDVHHKTNRVILGIGSTDVEAVDGYFRGSCKILL